MKTEQSSFLIGLLFQVSFVFTNQVDGKLVPIDSISPKVQRVEDNNVSHPNLNQNPKPKTMLLSRHRKPLESVASKQCSSSTARNNLSAYIKPLQRANVESVSVTSSLRCSVQDTLKPKHSTANQLPQKRLSPDTLSHDDDFQ